MLMWARADPSLAELHDIDPRYDRLAPAPQEPAAPQAKAMAKAFEIVARFKGLVGDPVPADFLSLSPFAAYRDALALRGIHDAARLRRTPGRELCSELGITRGEAARWREVTDLYQMAGVCLHAGREPGQPERYSCFSRPILTPSRRCAMRSETSAELRENLLGLARDWAVVAPGEEEIGTWGRHLGVPRR